MKAIGIIPARYASTRLPAKALADICGKPMIQHVVERCRASHLLSEIYVATDDVRIERVVQSFGGNVIMTPVDLQSGSDRIAFASRKLKADIVVNIQGDEPLIDPQMIDQAIQILTKKKTAVVSTLVKNINSPDDLVNPNVVKVVLDHEKFALYFSRSPIPFVRDTGYRSEWLTRTNCYKHIGLYGYRYDFLQRFASLSSSSLEKAEKLEQLRILENGYRIVVAVTDSDSIPVDTQEDLEKVRAMVEKRKK